MRWLPKDRRPGYTVNVKLGKRGTAVSTPCAFAEPTRRAFEGDSRLDANADRALAAAGQTAHSDRELDAVAVLDF